MIRAEQVYSFRGSVDIDISVDEEVAGVQFDLDYDPAAATYVSFAAASGASSLVTESPEGTLNIAVAKATALPAVIGTITFTVYQDTILTLSNASGSTTGAVDIELEEDHGQILIAEDNTVRIHPRPSIYRMHPVASSYRMNPRRQSFSYDNYTIAATSGGVVTAGVTVGLTATRLIATAAGAVTTDGTAVEFLRSRNLAVASGAVNAAGTAVLLLYPKGLAIEAGAVVTAGQAIGTLYGMGIVAAPGAVVTAGTVISLTSTRTMASAAGAVAVSGSSVSLQADRTVAVASGAVDVAGTALALLAGRLIAASSGAVVTAGNDIRFWFEVLVGLYPDLVTAARHKTYSVSKLSDRIVFTVEVTGGDYLVTRDVDLLLGVVAGQDKTVALNALVCPFFDASFAVDGDLISAVNYKIDSGSKTAIPAAYGTDLADRVRSFSLSFDSSGEKRLTLYVTDDDSNEYSDELIVRVSA